MLPYLTKKRQYNQSILTLQCEETMAIQPKANSKSHIPEKSFLFEKVIPIALIFMGVITLGLMIFAAGVLLGIIHF